MAWADWRSVVLSSCRRGHHLSSMKSLLAALMRPRREAHIIFGHLGQIHDRLQAPGLGVAPGRRRFARADRPVLNRVHRGARARAFEFVIRTVFPPSGSLPLPSARPEEIHLVRFRAGSQRSEASCANVFLWAPVKGKDAKSSGRIQRKAAEPFRRTRPLSLRHRYRSNTILKWV